MTALRSPCAETMRTKFSPMVSSRRGGSRGPWTRAWLRSPRCVRIIEKVEGHRRGDHSRISPRMSVSWYGLLRRRGVTQLDGQNLEADPSVLAVQVKLRTGARGCECRNTSPGRHFGCQVPLTSEIMPRSWERHDTVRGAAASYM